MLENEQSEANVSYRWSRVAPESSEDCEKFALTFKLELSEKFAKSAEPVNISLAALYNSDKLSMAGKTVADNAGPVMHTLELNRDSREGAFVIELKDGVTPKDVSIRVNLYCNSRWNGEVTPPIPSNL